MTPDEYMAKAQRALESAQLLRSNADTEGACNRAYYAMFNAAHAALVASDPATNLAAIRTHSGLIAAFGKLLVQSGRMSPDLGRSINRVEGIRRIADYTGEPISDEKTTAVLEQAKTFVERVTEDLRQSTS